MSLGDWARILGVGAILGTDYLLSRGGRVSEIPPRSDITGTEETARQLANQYGRAFKVPPRLLLAVWRIESNFNPFAVNMTGGDARRGGAWGLGQMTLRTARDLDDRFPELARKYWPGFHANPVGESLFNIRENTAMSAFLLSLGFKALGDDAIAAGLSYKMGIGYVANLLAEGGSMPADLTTGGQRYFGRLTEACQVYAA